uniref:Major facilitator superfamily (MFS) profile domain-containing protein n=1 Tax=Ditylenchus dipsaci TaxID=166011 RepID=A0A915E4K0_9BILA
MASNGLNQSSSLLENPRLKWLFRDNYRFFILFLGFFCTTCISANMSAFNFTLICMTPPLFNQTIDEINPANPVYPFTENQKAILMWSMAMGTLFSALPISWLYTIYGARYVLFAALVLSAVSTALFPLAASLGFGVLALLRLLQGVSYAADFAALGMLISKWASLKQNAIFLSVVSSYSPASSMITNSVSVVFLAVWLANGLLQFCSNNPQQSQFVSKKEVECINRDKSEEHINMTKFVPYRAILKSKLMWIVWLNAFADLCSGAWTLMYQPSYFKYVLKYSVEEAGFLTAIPTMLYLPLKIISGIASDKITFMSERTKMIICNTISVGFPGLAYLGITFSPTSFIAFLFFVFNAVVFAPAGGGFYKQHSHFIMASLQINKCLAMLLSPALMYFFVSDITSQVQWRIIFVIFAILCFVSSGLFCIVATDVPEPFTKLTSKVQKKKETTSYYFHLYMAIMWRPDRVIFNPYQIFFSGIWAFSYQISEPIAVLFLTIERLMSLGKTFGYNRRIKMLLAIVDLPLDLDKVSKCTFWSCIIIKYRNLPQQGIKVFFASLNLIFGGIFFYIIRNYKFNINNRSVKTIVLLELCLNAFPVYVGFTFNLVLGMNLSNFIGQYALLFCTLDAAVCGTLYSLLMTRKKPRLNNVVNVKGSMGIRITSQETKIAF